MADDSLSGRCLCGGVKFSMPKDDLDHPAVCHCGQCRRWSGHAWASINGPLDALYIIKGKDKLRWFRASYFARRGFCCDCGASLFWHADGLEKHQNRIAVALGALDAPTGIKLEEHIFTVDKGDYYEVADALPQKEKY